MQIMLDGPLETFVTEKVRSGRYVDAAEVVREALRMLERQYAVESPLLEAALLEGVRDEHVPYNAGTLDRVRQLADVL
ncbi:putative addiction module antidote protein, CC2985 family [Opitutaceae bacterium TAV1]|nr:putative addiction module antidote protein, CC2985 family [Opitutaceae bacterium TAV1]